MKKKNDFDKVLSQEFKHKTLDPNLSEDQLIFTNFRNPMRKVFTPHDEKKLRKKTLNIDFRK